MRERIARLDEPSLGPALDGIPPVVARFVEVMGKITDTQLTAAAERQPVNPPLMNPKIADEIVQASECISAIASLDSSLVLGPVSHTRQWWVSTSAHTGGEKPTQDSFLKPRHPRLLGRATTKPFDFCLYTSTALSNGTSMWLAYLREYGVPGLFPRPWQAWHVRPARDVTVKEITSASDWANFVLQHPLRRGQLVYPDWRRARAAFDGVHITARAVAAAQGWHLRLGETVFAPAFWDVETTLWLKWRFGTTPAYRVVG